MSDTKFSSSSFPQKFPENIAHLFSLTSKAEVVKYAQRLVLEKNDLVCAITYPWLGGYAHSGGFCEWQPEDAQLTPDDIDIARNRARRDELSKFIGKLDNMFKTRKHLSAHFFVRPGRWHLFYFTLNDMTEREPNHWKKGGHLHFINDLWPQYKLEDMVDRLFAQRKTLVGDSLHIQVREQEVEADA
jgi:hypothetical protein